MSVSMSCLHDLYFLHRCGVRGRTWAFPVRKFGIFTSGVTYKDRKMIKKQMGVMEENTCVRFTEVAKHSAPIHRLNITVGLLSRPSPSLARLFSSTGQGCL